MPRPIYTWRVTSTFTRRGRIVSTTADVRESNVTNAITFAFRRMPPIARLNCLQLTATRIDDPRLPRY
jgi:hypothetical protein